MGESLSRDEVLSTTYSSLNRNHLNFIHLIEKIEKLFSHILADELFRQLEVDEEGKITLEV